MKRRVYFTVAVLSAAFAFAARPTTADLLKAFENGETAAVLQILKDDPKMMTADLGAGMNALHYGVYYGNEACVRYDSEWIGACFPSEPSTPLDGGTDGG